MHLNKTHMFRCAKIVDIVSGKLERSEFTFELTQRDCGLVASGSWSAHFRTRTFRVTSEEDKANFSFCLFFVLCQQAPTMSKAKKSVTTVDSDPAFADAAEAANQNIDTDASV
jgi:hypothetical protein